MASTTENVQHAVDVLLKFRYPWLRGRVSLNAADDAMDIRLDVDVHALVSISHREIAMTRNSPAAVMDYVARQIDLAAWNMRELILAPQSGIPVK